MGLYTTFNKNTTEAEQLMVLAWLASKFQDKLRSNSGKSPVVFIWGYLDPIAAGDSVAEEIERQAMDKRIISIGKNLIRLGVPVDKIYPLDSKITNIGGHQHPIDIFLQEAGETNSVVPSVPLLGPDPHPAKTLKPTPPGKWEGNLSQEGIKVEVDLYSKESGKRTLLKTFKVKKSYGLSLKEWSIEIGAEVTLWKPEIDEILKKKRLEKFVGKFEFEVKVAGGRKLSKEFAAGISQEYSAKLSAGLSFIVSDGWKVSFEISTGYAIKDVDGKEERGSTPMTPLFKISRNF